VGGLEEQVSIIPTGWGTDMQRQVDARGAPDAAQNGAVAPHLGFRGYFAESCATPGVYSREAYLGLGLLGKTLRYSVDLSGAGCGCNVALSLASMRQNEEAGACADYFCDSSLTCGTPCTEVNIQEANQYAWRSTLHTATDPSGATAGFGGESTFDGPRDFSSSDYGPNGRCIDTSQPFQVSASFPINSQGKLQSMSVTLSQPGHECNLDMLVGEYSGMLSVGAALAAGMTPVINYWASDDMTWLDGVGSDGQGPCAVDEPSACAASVVFSDFSISPMGQRVDPVAAVTSDLSFDCTTGYPESTGDWSQEQLEWCCRNEHKGCALILVPRAGAAEARGEAGGVEVRGVLAQEPQRLLEQPAPMAVPEQPTSEISKPFDCMAGYPEWVDGWSQEQLTWCCHNEHKGCAALVHEVAETPTEPPAAIAASTAAPPTIAAATTAGTTAEPPATTASTTAEPPATTASTAAPGTSATATAGTTAEPPATTASGGAQAPAPAPPSVSSLVGELNCAPDYPTHLTGDNDPGRRSACLLGNNKKDGFGYWYNAGRGTSSATCKGDCWCCHRDLRKVPEKRAWALETTGASCKNWKQIQMFRTTTVDDPTVCGQLCQAHQGCVEFAYLSNDTCSEVGVTKKGSCMLFFGACDRKPSSCWDLYSMHEASGSEVEQPLPKLKQSAVTTTRTRTSTTTSTRTRTTTEGAARNLIVGVSDPMMLPHTAVDENLHSLAGQLACATPPAGYPGDDARAQCLRANLLKDGHNYVHNSARGTGTSCGDCDCCRRDTTAVPKTKSYMLKADGTSCKNWAQIKMFRSVEVNHSSVCGKLCASNRGCVQFAYLGADSCSEAGISKKGSCMLFAGDCEVQNSSCWSLYAMQTKEPNWQPLLDAASESTGLHQQRQTALRAASRSGAGPSHWLVVAACPLLAALAGAAVVAVRIAKGRQASPGRAAPSALGFLDLHGCCSPQSRAQLLAMSPERPLRGRGPAGAFEE